MKVLAPVCILILTLTACTSWIPTGGGDGEATEEGSDITNPLGALSALGGMAEEVKQLQKDLENHEPVDPVHFNELIPVLPEPPGGWEAQDPKGSTTQAAGGFTMSQASRTYRNGDQRVEIQVADWAYHKMVYMPFILGARMSTESTEGYNKGIKIGGDPGRDEFTFKSKRGKRTVLVGKRFAVTLETRGLEEDELKEWWTRINTEKLRSMAG